MTQSGMEEFDDEPGVEGQVFELDRRAVADLANIADVAGRVADHTRTPDAIVEAVVDVSVQP